MSAVTPRPRRSVPLAQLVLLAGVLALLAIAGGALAVTLVAERPLPWQFHMRAVSPHVGVAFTVLGLAALQLSLSKGDRRHRLLGYAWCGLMAVLAISGIAIQLGPRGGPSIIHLASSGFSAATLILLPVVVWSARTGRRKLHRSAVLALVFLTVQAGALTFIPFRTMGQLTQSAVAAVVGGPAAGR